MEVKMFHLHLFSCHYYVIILLSILIILCFQPADSASTFSSDHFDPYYDCAPFELNCGNQTIEISYPFWISGRPEYCGVREGFEITCTFDGYPGIEIGTSEPSNYSSYRIQELDLANQTLTMVRMDFLDRDSCPSSSPNTTWDISPFNYTEDNQKLALFYNCSSPIPEDAFTRLPCSTAISGTYAYYATDSIAQFPHQGCSKHSPIIYAAVKLNETAADRLLSGGYNETSFVEVLQQGFEATWTTPAGEWWCSTCVQSGGRCGYNTTENVPLCFCSGGNKYTPSLECPGTTTVDPYHGCAPSQLNCTHQSLDISYPFRTSDRPDYCGVPGYEISCSTNGYPVIQVADNTTYVDILTPNGYSGSLDYSRISELFNSSSYEPNYQIKELDVMNRMLTIVSTHFVDGNCPDFLSNFNSWDISPYSFTDRDHKLTLFFGCASPVTGPGFTALNCSYANYYATDSMTQVPSQVYNDCIGINIVLHQTAVDRLNKSGDLTEALQEGFQVTWSAGGDGWCSKCVQSGGRCGYNITAPKQPDLCFCPGNEPSSSECPAAVAKDGVDKDGSSRRKKIVIGVAAATGSLLVAFSSLAFYACAFGPKKIRKSIIFGSKHNKGQKVEEFLENCGSLGPKRYNYSDVKKMTRAFSDKLGQGGYGAVFKGKLADGRVVAVKVLSNSKGNGEEFINEVASIGRTHHVNIVSLLGFCSDGTERALIYEFMPNGSLEKFIYSEEARTDTKALGWEKLYDIAIGIARGLEYLHRGCHMRILHFDIKPHNILLDEDFCPKISDFGLAKLYSGKVSIVSTLGARGTAGYIAPEFFCRNFGAVSSKSDVYSYGMMILEMVGGRKNIDIRVENESAIYFPHWVYKHLSIDGDLKECGASTQAEEEIARKMILVGLWCIQTDPTSRPSISRAVEMLQGTVEELKIPPKPYLSSPSRSQDEEPSLTTES